MVQQLYAMKTMVAASVSTETVFVLDVVDLFGGSFLSLSSFFCLL